MPPRDPTQILDSARRAALGYAKQTSATTVRRLLLASQTELKRRLQDIPASDKSFTTVQMRATLKQIQAVLPGLQRGLTGTVVQGGATVGASSAEATLRYLGEAEKAYKGVGGYGLSINTAMVLDHAVSGTNASVVRRIAEDPYHPGQPGVVSRYSGAVQEHFEKTLQVALTTGMPWDDIKAQMVQGSPFLQSAPEYWAERLVRTEMMGAYNTASNLSLVQVDQQTGGRMLRILCAIFDDRTGSDSYAVHGQIRRTDEPFDYWYGLQFMTPPNRPNDREIIVPHHQEWPIPANLTPKTDAEVLERWLHEKRKGNPPARPKMTTVPLDQIGKPGPTPQPPGPVPQPPEGPVPGPEPGRGPLPVGTATEATVLPQGFTPDEWLTLMQREQGLDVSVLGFRQTPENFVDVIHPIHPDLNRIAVQEDVVRLASTHRATPVAVGDIMFPKFAVGSAEDLRYLVHHNLKALKTLGKPTGIRLPDGRVVLARGGENLVVDRIKDLSKTKAKPGTLSPTQTIKLQVVDAAVVLAHQGLIPRVQGTGKVAQVVREQAKVLRDPKTALPALRQVMEANGFKVRRGKQIEVSTAMDHALVRQKALGIHRWDGTIGIESHMWDSHEEVMTRFVTGKDAPNAKLTGTRVVFHEMVHGCSPGEMTAYAKGGKVIDEAFTELLSRDLADQVFGTKVATTHGVFYQDLIDALVKLAEERLGIRVQEPAGIAKLTAAERARVRMDARRQAVVPRLLEIARTMWGDQAYQVPLDYCRRFNELTGKGAGLVAASELNQQLTRLL